ncbi:hypothetical protein OIM94_19575 (plasmid) [Sphingomonas sp. R1]|nr:hypothetical protein [Sphingomonas sp. R1]UYY79655.1 hypothetical protein OIM94_19575 [Sphingomonas sp. R1]
MDAKVLRFCLVKRGLVAPRAGRIGLQEVGCRHGVSGGDHRFSEVLAAYVDGSDRPPIALLSRQPDRHGASLHQLGCEVLGGLAAGPTGRTLRAERFALDGIRAKQAEIDGNRVPVDRVRLRLEAVAVALTWASPQGLCARQRFGRHNANIG